MHYLDMAYTNSIIRRFRSHVYIYHYHLFIATSLLFKLLSNITLNAFKTMSSVRFNVSITQASLNNTYFHIRKKKLKTYTVRKKSGLLLAETQYRLRHNTWGYCTAELYCNSNSVNRIFRSHNRLSVTVYEESKQTNTLMPLREVMAASDKKPWR